MMLSPQYANRIETSALLLSGLCVIHCLGLPLLFLALPILASVFVVPESLHLYLVLLALPLSLTSLIYGARQHKSFLPLVIGSIGLCSMAVALTEAYHNEEVLLTVLGATGLAVAHIFNWKWRSRRRLNRSF